MRNVRFLYLSQEDVVRAGGLDMARTIEGVEKSFSLLEKGEALEPDAPQIMFEGQAGRRVSMHPSFVGSDVNTVGIKWVVSNPANPRTIGYPRATGMLIINDPIKGHPLAVLDGTVISAMRTGAVTGVGFKHLGRPESEVAGILGAGVIARTNLMALKEVMKNVRDIKVFDLLYDKAMAWAKDMSARLSLPVRAVRTAQECVEGSDVVAGCTTVSADKAYVEPQWIKEGSLYSNISDNDARPETILQADRLIVDGPRQFTIPTIMGVMAKAGQISFANAHATIGEVINGKKPGRLSPKDRVFYSCLGIGCHDIINARRIYEEARRQGIGVGLDLWQEPYFE